MITREGEGRMETILIILDYISKGVVWVGDSTKACNASQSGALCGVFT